MSDGSKVDLTMMITEYTKFGILLLEDKTGAVIESIEKEHGRSAPDINHKILMKWIRGEGRQPVTWTTLVNVLQKIGQGALAKNISEVKC
jgi:hypothetical protein